MDTFDHVRNILAAALSLGDRASTLTLDSPLLGAVPEFDSMAVVTVVTLLEDELGITMDDDELSAEVFTSVGNLVKLVDSKLKL